MAEYLNNNIKYLRSIKKLSQQELAKKVGVDRSTISRIENGTIETTIDNAIKIAEALNVSLYDLIGYDIKTMELPPKKTHEQYKQILKDKGLMDENENINEEDFNKLMKIANMIQDLEKNKEDQK